MKHKLTSDEKELIWELEEYKRALTRWDSRDVSKQERENLRSLINQQTPSIRKLVWRAGCGKTIDIVPPPAVGGPVLRGVDPFACIFESPYLLNMGRPVADMIDETIGVISTGELPPPTEHRSGSKDKVRRHHSKNKVFLVHGHDGEAKESVARFLEKLGLKVIILHEKASSSMTIIEKFERNSDVAYAVVLMTPDDVGAVVTERDNLHLRARQNVIFELGYFMGKLGRKNICALLRGDIERPSDYHGIIYIAFDPADGWKLLLAKEMKESGLDVDLNQAV